MAKMYKEARGSGAEMMKKGSRTYSTLNGERANKYMAYSAGEKRRYNPPPELKDNTHASKVYGIPTDSEKYDMGRMRYFSSGTRGYPAQAIQGGDY